MAERKEDIQIKAENKGDTVERHQATKIMDRLIPRDRMDHEVESWLEKIEKDPQQIQDQQMGNTVTSLKAVSQNTDDVYNIPISKRDFVAGFKKSIDEATRWLSVFILRIVKKKQGKVKFSQEEKENE